MLKQPQYEPMDVAKQVIAIWAASNGYIDDVPVDKVRHFESEMYKYLDNAGASLLDAMREKRAIDESMKGVLRAGLDDFKQRYAAQSAAGAAA